MAMCIAQPGSASHRNLERRGFRVAYTRVKFMRERGVRDSGEKQSQKILNFIRSHFLFVYQRAVWRANGSGAPETESL